MKSNLDKIEKDLEKLAKKGIKLQLSMLHELGILDSVENIDDFEEEFKPIPFNRHYEQWYSEAYIVIKQLTPHRLNDFQALYKNDKRKNLEYTTYTVSDYIIGVVSRRGNEVILDTDAAVPKFQQQLDILASARKRISSSLYDIKQILQADLFDSELDSARELLKKGFLRASGAISGVLIEKHLNQVLQNHEIPIRKKNPSIADYNDLLKSNEVYEVPTWRFIQRLGDLRNLCDHFKDKEPQKNDIEELINGTYKIIKTIF